MSNERMKKWGISQAELTLRWDYGQGKIALKEFNHHFEELKQQGKIIRSGKVIR